MQRTVDFRDWGEFGIRWWERRSRESGASLSPLSSLVPSQELEQSSGVGVLAHAATTPDAIKIKENWTIRRILLNMPTSAPSRRLGVVVAGRTDVGRVRSRNEDARIRLRHWPSQWPLPEG